MTEFGWRCRTCGCRESWTSETASKLAGIRHVRVQHPDRFSVDAATDEWTTANPPEKYGRKLDDWESQL